MRRLALVGIVAIAVAVIAWWRCSSPAASETPATPPATVAAGSATPTAVATSSIAGTVTAAGRPVSATVCADRLGDEDDVPICAQGSAYLLEVPPGKYVVSASAASYLPASSGRVIVRAGEHLTGVDLVLATGGVELRGTVVDVTGGPIAHARISTVKVAYRDEGSRVSVESDDRGAFSMWLAPGARMLLANATGYATRMAIAYTPGSVAIVMTPEATLDGTVVDGTTHAPVEGVRVELGRGGAGDNEPQATTTDARGAFHFERLDPGRVDLEARGSHVFGRVGESVLVGLGQHVGGVAIEVWPASRVEGRVVVRGGEACEKPWVSLYDEHARSTAVLRGDDPLAADGVLPGRYKPFVRCEGRVARDDYPDVVVGTADVAGLVWEVERGATVRGVVRLRGGGPIAGATVSSDVGLAHTSFDGRYELIGATAGPHRLQVRGPGLAGTASDSVDVAGTGVVEHDVVVDAGGAIAGLLVDPAGAPLDATMVLAKTAGTPRVAGGSMTGRDGAFTITGLPPGDYDVSPGDVDARTVAAAVRAGATTTVRLVGGARGQIRGVVLAGGRPLADVYVYEGYGRPGFPAPLLTGADGGFVIDGVGAGEHTVTAYRPGGGSVTAEHVAPGSTITLELQPTAAIEGVVRDPDGAPCEDFTISTLGRWEHLYRRAGRFAIHDLPPGNVVVTVRAPSGNAGVELALAPGETRSLALVLRAGVRVTGRVVDKVGAPVAGVPVMAMTKHGVAAQAVTDASGRFALADVPHAEVSIAASGPGGVAHVDRTIESDGPVDLGELVLKSE